MSHLERALERIQAIDWPKMSYWEHERSNAWLLLEYLHCEDAWREAIDPHKEHQFGRVYDIASKINPKVRAPEHALEIVDIHCKNRFIFDKALCKMYLHWAALKDVDDLERFSHLFDPYEPLILMFERGAHILKENVFINVSPGYAVNLHFYRDIVIPDEVKLLDIEYLDNIDLEYNQKRDKRDFIARIQHNLRQLRKNSLYGKVFGTEISFQLGEDTCRADAAFVTHERWATVTEPEKFIPFAPNLAVEVVSPHDTASEIQQKVAKYLTNGTHRVWIVYPELRQVIVHFADHTTRMFDETQVLDGGEMLPDLAIPVNKIFPPVK